MSSLSVKVYRNGEIRRFHLDAGEEQRFGYQRLVNKVHFLFPDLESSRVRFVWKDDDGEFVIVSSNEELAEAIRNLPADDPVLRIHIVDAGDVDHAKREQQQEEDQQREKAEEQADPTLHGHVHCDGCQGPVRGIRYKCLTCPDFDLCSVCIEKGHDHSMIRIVSPTDKSWKPAFFAVHAQQGFGFSRGRGFGNFHGRGRGSGHFGPQFMGPFWDGPFFGGRGRGGMHCPWGMRRRCQAKTDEAKQQDQNQGKAQEDQRQALHDEIVRNLSEVVDSVIGVIDIPVEMETDNDQSKNGTTDKQTNVTKETEPTPQAAASSTSTPPPPSHPDPRVAAGLYYMLAMGYKNDGGWLTRLLEEKQGDVSAVLDILHPNQSR